MILTSTYNDTIDKKLEKKMKLLGQKSGDLEVAMKQKVDL